VDEVLARLVSGRAKLELQRVPLADLPRWHRRLEAGLTTGKIVAAI
jgi:hypothetical protein